VLRNDCEYVHFVTRDLTLASLLQAQELALLGDSVSEPLQPPLQNPNQQTPERVKHKKKREKKPKRDDEANSTPTRRQLSLSTENLLNSTLASNMNLAPASPQRAEVQVQPYEFSSPPNPVEREKIGVSVDIGLSTNRDRNGDLKPLKSPVRLIGSPSLLSAGVKQANPAPNPSPERSRKKGFGRDRERRKKQSAQVAPVAFIDDADASASPMAAFGQLKVPQPTSPHPTALEYTKQQNARLLSLLRHSTDINMEPQEARAFTAAEPGQPQPLVERASTTLGVGTHLGLSYSDDDGGSLQGR